MGGSIHARHGATGRVLLVVEDPPSVAGRAVEAGATETSAVAKHATDRLGVVTENVRPAARPLDWWECQTEHGQLSERQGPRVVGALRST
jgi:hypothetical protein